MINYRNNRGSITLFVLVSCMFLIASVTCVQVYLQSKQTAVDRNYRQIKSNYEQNTLDENSLNEDYLQLKRLKNTTINIAEATITNNILNVKFTIENAEDLEITKMKYGWGTSDNIKTVDKWIYVDDVKINEELQIANNKINSQKKYYLYVVVNDKVLYSEINV